MFGPRDRVPTLSEDILSFYHLTECDLSRACCQGTACFAARHLNSARWQTAIQSPKRLYCLGNCFAAPARGEDLTRPSIGIHSREAIVLERIADGGATTLSEYQNKEGFTALDAALRLNPDQIIAEVDTAGLRGRGGAGFPTGIKWRAVEQQGSRDRFVVANLDEGDPGAYIDRMIAEDDPFCLIEGMAIAARAVGASKGWIYTRCEYPRAAASLRVAIESARSAGILGPRVLDSDFAFDIELVEGRGSYLCGEETALLNSIEGKRPVARVRPPYVAEAGLWERPTALNNVETLATIPWIIRNGGTRYAAIGIPGSAGTKAISLGSLFSRPGLYEVEFGISLREIVEEIGGGLRIGELRALMIGGPLAGILPPRLLDTTFGFKELQEVGGAVGHGGVIAFDEQTSIPELVHHVFSFAAYESCGKCTPCRLGPKRIEALLQAFLNGTGTARRETEWQDIVAALRLASLCGFGTGLAEFAESVSRYFSAELTKCWN